MTASGRRRVAHLEALSLLKLMRSMTEPKPADKMLAEAISAQRAIDRIVRTLSEETGAPIAPLDPTLRDGMLKLDQLLRELLTPHGFLCMMFSFGDDAWINYVTNAEEADCAELMRELIKAFEQPPAKVPG